MRRNIEIKARVSDLRNLRAKAAALANSPAEILLQTDTFFVVPRGRLKLREFADGSGELIYYERPDQIGPKESSYSRYPCDYPRGLAALLTDALGVRGVVEKRRELYLAGRTRIHLDEVHGLGDFLELEVVLQESESPADGEREAQDLLTALGVRPDDLVPQAYIDLLERLPARR